MNRKLTKQEKETLSRLYDDKSLNGRGHLRQFILINTYEPKYKIGDYVLITDLSMRLFGNIAKDIRCQITAINWLVREKGAEQIQYEAIALDQNGNDYFMCAEENINGAPTERHINGYCDNNINIIEKKSQSSQETSF